MKNFNKIARETRTKSVDLTAKQPQLIGQIMQTLHNCRDCEWCEKMPQGDRYRCNHNGFTYRYHHLTYCTQFNSHSKSHNYVTTAS